MKPFVLVDRTILKKLGYQNTWKQMKKVSKINMESQK